MGSLEWLLALSRISERGLSGRLLTRARQDAETSYTHCVFKKKEKLEMLSDRATPLNEFLLVLKRCVFPITDNCRRIPKMFSGNFCAKIERIAARILRNVIFAKVL